MKLFIKLSKKMSYKIRSKCVVKIAKRFFFSWHITSNLHGFSNDCHTISEKTLKICQGKVKLQDDIMLVAILHVTGWPTQIP